MCKKKERFEEDNILHAWKKAWENKDIIWELVIISYQASYRGAKKNKKENFLQKHLFIAAVQIVLWAECVFLVYSAIQGTLKLEGGELITDAVFFSVFQAGAFYANGKRIAVDKKQETWVRHSTTLEMMREEMVRYVQKLPPYKDLDKSARDMIFSENFLKIQEANQKKFAENMESKEASILDIVERMKFPKS